MTAERTQVGVVLGTPSYAGARAGERPCVRSSVRHLQPGRHPLRDLSGQSPFRGSNTAETISRNPPRRGQGILRRAFDSARARSRRPALVSKRAARPISKRPRLGVRARGAASADGIFAGCENHAPAGIEEVPAGAPHRSGARGGDGRRLAAAVAHRRRAAATKQSRTTSDGLQLPGISAIARRQIRSVHGGRCRQTPDIRPADRRRHAAANHRDSADHQFPAGRRRQFDRVFLAGRGRGNGRALFPRSQRWGRATADHQQPGRRAPMSGSRTGGSRIRGWPRGRSTL